jgi:hypothetical protein
MDRSSLKNSGLSAYSEGP